MTEEHSKDETDNIIRPRKIVKRLPKFGSNKNPNFGKLQLPRRINYDDEK